MGTATFNCDYQYPKEPKGWGKLRARDKFLVIAQKSGMIVDADENVDAATETARRLASKHQEEYLVFKLVKRVWKKPTNIEESEVE